MQTFSILFILALLLSLTTQLWLSIRQVKAVSQNRAAVPDAFAEQITVEQHHKAADYTLAKLAVNKIDHQKAACQLSKILRKNLGLSPVLTRTPVPEALAAHRLRWDSFTERLSRACYSSFGVDQEQTTFLLKEAYFWVKSWPIHNNA